MSRALFAQRNIALHGTTCCLSNNYRRLALQASPSDGPTEDEHREARTWLARFNVNTIPKNACEVTFSRSSGPGGQNVNKVNSKATLRIHTKDFLPLVPKLLHSAIEGSRYYAENSKSMIIQGDGSRNRTDNAQECYKKLHALIVAIGRSTVRGETSPDRVEKVKVLQRKENEMRLRTKKAHGNKKAARKSTSKGSSY